MNRSNRIIAAVGLLLAAGMDCLSGSAYALNPRTALSALEAIGKSAAVREIVVVVGESSPALKSLAKQIGIAASDSAGLAEAFGRLSAAERGAIILHDKALGEALLSSSRLRSVPADQDKLIGVFNSFKAERIGRQNLPGWVAPTDDSFFVNTQSRGVLSATIEKNQAVTQTKIDPIAGEIIFAKPKRLGTFGNYSIELTKIKVDDLLTKGTAVGAGVACGITSQCWKPAAEKLKSLLNEPSPPATPQKPNCFGAAIPWRR